MGTSMILGLELKAESLSADYTDSTDYEKLKTKGHRTSEREKRTGKAKGGRPR